jgi:prepilin-type N-terminal cleavage/methylation domain-containing protein
MKNQKGFTLIELLLVLAIIGIISAIAIPALLGQRARARDKSAQENCTSILTDIVAAYDKAKEQGADVSTAAALTAVCTVGTGMTPVAPQCPQLLDAKNPWNGTVAVPLAYAAAIGALATPDAAGARALPATAALLGQVQMGFLPPNPATAQAGTVGTAVYLQNPFTDPLIGSTHVFYKLGNVD